MWRVRSMVAVLALALPASATEIYRWTDGAGKVHFSNTPNTDAAATAVGGAAAEVRG